MIAACSLSNDSRTTAGILLTIVAVEFGGLTMLRIVRGRQPHRVPEILRPRRPPLAVGTPGYHWNAGLLSR